MALLSAARTLPRDQLPLPFIDAGTDEEPGGELGVVGLRDSAEEIRWLQPLAECARAASAAERKPRALRRLIRRAGEPVLVFTEYRDTVHRLATELADFAPLQLHGGLAARERLDVLRCFSSGDAMVLLATDAASEGLNLHHRCRLVVNLELPWTPLRLEQRIGRVDRLGQRRRVHAVQLIAAATHEESMVVRLGERSGRIEAAFAPSADPRLLRAADDEAARLHVSRSLARTARVAPAHEPMIAVVAGDRTETVWALRLCCCDAAGQPLFETIAAIRDERGGIFLDRAVNDAALLHHGRVLAAASDASAPWLTLAARREEAVVAALHESHARLSAALLQPGLFDRRVERAAAAQAARVDEAAAKSRLRLEMLARWRCLRADERTLLFGVAFRS